MGNVKVIRRGPENDNDAYKTYDDGNPALDAYFILQDKRREKRNDKGRGKGQANVFRDGNILQ